MNAEHVAGHRQDLVVKFLSECEKSREALAFSWRSVQQMENRDAEDWTQVCLVQQPKCKCGTPVA